MTAKTVPQHPDARPVIRTEAEVIATAKAIVMHGLVTCRLGLRLDPDGRAIPLTPHDRAYLEPVAMRALAAADPDRRVDVASDVVGELVKALWLPDNDREFADCLREAITRYETRLAEALEA